MHFTVHDLSHQPEKSREPPDPRPKADATTPCSIAGVPAAILSGCRRTLRPTIITVDRRMVELGSLEAAAGPGLPRRTSRPPPQDRPGSFEGAEILIPGRSSGLPMNSMPADSKASRSFSRVRIVVSGTPEEFSILPRVRLDTPARSQSSLELHPNMPLAPRI